MDARITAYLQGDVAAGQQLLLELLPRVRNIVRSLSGRDVDVDDTAQQIMVEVIRGLSSYRGDSPLVGWVDRITVRVTLANARRARNRDSRERPLEDTELERPRVVDLHQVGAERYLQRRRAVALLDGLPEAQRSAVVLHHVLGFSVFEIADQEKASPETIRSRLRSGIQKLRSWTDGVGQKDAAQ